MVPNFVWKFTNSLHRLFLSLYMNRITRAAPILSDLGIVVLFKESDAVVLPERVGQKLVTSR